MMVNRRERVRAATVQEIKEVARKQLVTNGPNAVSLRAIAREMGMTAPALYRYFPSFDHLVAALVDDLYGEVCAAMEDTRDLIPAEQPGLQLLAVCRTFRAWAVGHPAEFGLVFNNAVDRKPQPDSSSTRYNQDRNQLGGVRFGAVFLGLIHALWPQGQFSTPTPDDIEPTLAQQLSQYRETVASPLPLGALAVAVDTWMEVYGLVSLEIFGHLRFAENGEAYFEQKLSQLATRLGIAQQYQQSRS